MKTTVESPDPLHRTISIELPWAMLAEELDREYRELARKVQLKGFRKGKVPRNVLEQRFGEQVRADVLGRLVQEAYEAALIQNRIQPVARPEVEAGEFAKGQPYQFTAKVEVSPQIELKQIGGFSVVRKPIELDAAAIETELGRLRESRAVLVPVEGRAEARRGDVAILDYQASRDGQPLEGGQKSDHQVELGAGNTVPGFDEQVIGMHIGQRKEFDLDFPAEGYPEQVAGKRIHFSLDLRALKARELPALDDEFAKDLGEDGVVDVAGVRALVERRLREGLEAKADRDAKASLIDQLLGANPFPVPPKLVERQRAAMLQERQAVLRFQGLTPDQIADGTPKMIEDLGPRAEREVATALLLQAVGDEEKIEVGDADVQAHLERVSKKSGQSLAQLKALYAEQQRLEDLKVSLRRDKVVDHLMKLSNMDAATGEAPPAAVPPPGETE